MTPEGLYNIRKIQGTSKKINIDEDKLYEEMRGVFRRCQHNAIGIYGTNFNTSIFYSNISQDAKYINEVNEHLRKYNLIIDYYPRNKDFRGQWIVDTIYVPLE